MNNQSRENQGSDLTGRIAVIVGGSRGIGEQIARRLAGAGAEVVISSRKIEACDRVASAIVAEGGKAHAAICHQGDMESVKTFMDGVEQQFGRVDILVNCGATNPHYGPCADMPEWAFDKTIEVNVKGPFFLTALASKIMPEGGAIVNVASVNGKLPGPLQGLYSMTKAAIINMTKVYAQELAPRQIRVNALLPGFTDTDMTAAFKQDEKMLDGLLNTFIPMRRMADPSEMAGAVHFLVSDDASYVTGSCLTVDGGYLRQD